MAERRAAPIRKTPELIILDTVEPREIRWLWEPYIPAGMVTLLEGDPGLGKSYISAALASALSRGLPLPGQAQGTGKPQNVLLLSAEDPVEEVLVPRLIGMGADLKHLAIPKQGFILDSQGIKDLTSLMHTFTAAIVFIDPFTVYMGAKVDMNRSNEIRGIMAPLADLAKFSGAAVVVVRHLRKGQAGDKAIYKGMGSIDTLAAARSVLQVESSADGRRLMRHIKCNVAPLGPGWEYTLDKEGFRWAGEIDSSLDDILPQGSGNPKSAYARRKRAREFLHDFLRDGPQPANVVAQAAEEAGISKATLNRAKVGVAVSVQSEQNKWVWELDPKLEWADNG